jgi:hypothetical protein
VDPKNDSGISKIHKIIFQDGLVMRDPKTAFQTTVGKAVEKIAPSFHPRGPLMPKEAREYLTAHMTYLHTATMNRVLDKNNTRPTICYQRSFQDALTSALTCIAADTSLEPTVIVSYDPEALVALLLLVHHLPNVKQRESCRIYLHWFGSYWFSMSQVYQLLSTDLRKQCTIRNPGNAWMGALLVTTSFVFEWSDKDLSMDLLLDTLALFTRHKSIGDRRACIVKDSNTLQVYAFESGFDWKIRESDKERILFLDEGTWILFLIHVSQRSMTERLRNESEAEDEEAEEDEEEQREHLHTPWNLSSVDESIEIIQPMTYLQTWCREQLSSVAIQHIRVRRLKHYLEHWGRLKPNTAPAACMLSVRKDLDHGWSFAHLPRPWSTHALFDWRRNSGENTTWVDISQHDISFNVPSTKQQPFSHNLYEVKPLSLMAPLVPANALLKHSAIV